MCSRLGLNGHWREGDRCPDCGERKCVTDYRQGDTICTGCGLVLCGVLFDERPEWRTFSDNEGAPDRNRCGPCLPSNPLTTTAPIPATTIAVDPAFGRGSSQGGRQGGFRPPTQRLRRMHAQATRSAEKTFDAELRDMRDIFDNETSGASLKGPAADLALAMYVFLRAHAGKYVHPQQKKAYMAVCTLYASRTAGSRRTVHEAANAFRVETKPMFIAIREIQRLTRVNAEAARIFGSAMQQSSDTTDGLARIVQHIAPPPQKNALLQTCRKLAAFAKQHGVDAHANPNHFCYALVRVGCEVCGIDDVNDATFAACFATSINTIKRHAHSIREAMKLAFREMHPPTAPSAPA